VLDLVLLNQQRSLLQPFLRLLCLLLFSLDLLSKVSPFSEEGDLLLGHSAVAVGHDLSERLAGIDVGLT
jgi:hypothetical protein